MQFILAIDYTDLTNSVTFFLQCTQLMKKKIFSFLNLFMTVVQFSLLYSKFFFSVQHLSKIVTAFCFLVKPKAIMIDLNLIYNIHFVTFLLQVVTDIKGRKRLEQQFCQKLQVTRTLLMDEERNLKRYADHFFTQIVIMGE